jgi:ABC-type nickel/cobalt efflux system permease component RcnA
MRKPVALQGMIYTVWKVGVSVVGRCAIVVLGTSGALVVSPYIAQACSVCGGFAMGTDPGTGFNTSILFLLSMPYVLVGAIAGWLIYRHWRPSSRRHEVESRRETA